MFKVTVNNKEFKVEPLSLSFKVNDKEFSPDILEYKAGKFHVLMENRSYEALVAGIIPEERKITLMINNRSYNVSVKDKYDELLKEMGIDVADARKINDIKAPMPGLVLNVLVQSGQPIQKGDTIIVLEAMKMENILRAPSDGVVKKIHVVKGDKVEKNQVMVDLV